MVFDVVGTKSLLPREKDEIKGRRKLTAERDKVVVRPFLPASLVERRGWPFARRRDET